jgi:hypothetical protein
VNKVDVIFGSAADRRRFSGATGKALEIDHDRVTVAFVALEVDMLGPLGDIDKSQKTTG